MDVGRGITYVFEDTDWLKKVAIGGIISLVPILNLATYFLEVLEQIAGGAELPLPEWDDLGGKWVNGLLLALIMFVWALPGVILMGVSIVPLLMAALTSQGDAGQAAGLAALGGMMVFMALSGIYLLLVAVVTPAITLNYVREGSFGSGFKFGQIFTYITTNISGYFMVLLLIFGVGIAVGIVGSILSAIPLLGQIALIFLGFYAMLVYAHYLAQYWRNNFGSPAAAVEASSPESGTY